MATQTAKILTVNGWFQTLETTIVFITQYLCRIIKNLVI